MRLFLQHQGRLHGYVRSMVFNRADAEEVLQEVATAAWRKFDSFDAEAPGSRFDKWIYTIARYQVRYYFQKHARDVLHFSEATVDLLDATIRRRDDDVGDYRESLESCMSKLRDADRDVLRRRYSEGATNRSTARDLGISESKMSRTLNRVHAALLLCIKQSESAGGVT